MSLQGRRQLALVELILVVFILALSASALVQVFVRAYHMSQESSLQSEALVQAQSLLEDFKAHPLEPEVFCPLRDGWELIGEGQWQQSRAASDGATMVITLRWQVEEQSAGSLADAQVIVRTTSGTELVQLQTSRYVPRY